MGIFCSTYEFRLSALDDVREATTPPIVVVVVVVGFIPFCEFDLLHNFWFASNFCNCRLLCCCFIKLVTRPPSFEASSFAACHLVACSIPMPLLLLLLLLGPLSLTTPAVVKFPSMAIPMRSLLSFESFEEGGKFELLNFTRLIWSSTGQLSTIWKAWQIRLLNLSAFVLCSSCWNSNLAMAWVSSGQTHK